MSGTPISTWVNKTAFTSKVKASFKCSSASLRLILKKIHTAHIQQVPLNSRDTEQKTRYEHNECHFFIQQSWKWVFKKHTVLACFLEHFISWQSCGHLDVLECLFFFLFKSLFLFVFQQLSGQPCVYWLSLSALWETCCLWSDHSLLMSALFGAVLIGNFLLKCHFPFLCTCCCCVFVHRGAKVQDIDLIAFLFCT